MTWEQKSEMCKFLNTEQYEKALDLVIENIKTIDEQGWDMYFNGICLTKDEIKPLLSKHQIVNNASRFNQTSSYRSAIRMATYENMVDELTTQAMVESIDKLENLNK